jgi:D-inositol-3-phosphate glycosyltransferase
MASAAGPPKVRVQYRLSEYISHRRAGSDYRALLAASSKLVDQADDADVVVLHDEPDRYEDVFEDEPGLGRRVTVGYVVWEASALPAAYRSCIERCDVLWTASRYCASVLAAHHPRVRVVPHVVARSPASPQARARMAAAIGLDARRPYFISFQKRNDKRKNGRTLLDVFARFHERHPDVRLVVKDAVRPSDDERRTLGSRGIEFVPGFLEEDDISALHELSIGCVSLHHAEGWGLTLSDAMSLGRPVVAPRYSGNLDFMDDTNSFLVATEERPIRVEDRFGFFDGTMAWGYPDEDDALEKLEEAYCMHEAGTLAARGEKARRDVARFSPEGVRPILLEALEEAAALGRGRGVRTPANRPRPSAPYYVAMAYRLPEAGGPIVGLQVAVDGFVRALDRHATVPCDLFASTPQAGGVRSRMRLDPDRAGRQAVAIRDARALLDPGVAGRLGVWHDLAFEVGRTASIRRSLRGSFPITLTHHTLSYRELLLDAFVPLLLEGPAPYDSIVCSSTAARQAVANLLEHVAERLNRGLGTRLAYRGRLDLIPLGVDTDRFRPRDRLQARARLGLREDAFMLLWVGRLSATDKADLVPLVRVVAELARAHPTRGVVLLCIGTERPEEGFGKVLRAYARQLGASEHVVVLDDRREGAHWVYAAADVFVSPVDSPQESFGLAPVEAMACGIPQVVSDWNGYRDTVEEGETGFRVPTMWAPCDDDLVAMSGFHETSYDHLAIGQSVVVDYEIFRSRLELLMSDESLRARLGAHSRTRALELFSLERTVSRHVELWAELAAAARAAPVDLSATAGDLALPYAEVFGHYATRSMGPDDAVTLTALGRDVVRGAAKVHLHVTTPGILDSRASQLLLTLVVRADGAHKSARAGELVGATVQGLGVSLGAAQRHLLWLAKQGYLRVEEKPDDT